MIDIYEIKFKDNNNWIIRICKEDEKGNEVPELNVCLRYNEPWQSAIKEYLDTFFTNHPNIQNFKQVRDEQRGINFYEIIANDGSKLSIDDMNIARHYSKIAELINK